MDCIITNFNFWKNLKTWKRISKNHKNLNIFSNFKRSPWEFLRLGSKNQKQIYIFRAFFIILLQNISLPKSFFKSLAIFLAIDQSQGKHSRLILQKKL